MTDTTYLTVEEAATRLEKTTRTLWRWIKQDEDIKKLLPTVTAKERGLVGGNPDKVFLREEDVEVLAKKLGKSSPSAQQAEASQSHDLDMTMTSGDTMSTELQHLEQKVTDQGEQLVKLNDVFYAFIVKTEKQLHDIREVALKTMQDRIEYLEQEHSKQFDELNQRINELAEQLALDRSRMAEKTHEAQEGVPVLVPLKTVQNVTTEPNKAIEPKKGRPAGIKTIIDPPVPGAIPHYEFADRYGVVRRTFADHIDKGIKGDKVPAIIQDHPSRPNEKLRWLTPEQQEQALAFWKEHGVATFLPDRWVALNTFAKEHGLNRNELEQLGHQGMISGIEHGKWVTSAGEKVHVALSPEGQKNALAYFRKG